MAAPAPCTIVVLLLPDGPVVVLEDVQFCTEYTATGASEHDRLHIHVVVGVCPRPPAGPAAAPPQPRSHRRLAANPAMQGATRWPTPPVLRSWALLLAPILAAPAPPSPWRTTESSVRARAWEGQREYVVCYGKQSDRERGGGGCTNGRVRRVLSYC